MNAIALVASKVDMAALESAVARDSELDIDRHLRPDLLAVLLYQRFTPRFQTVFRHGVDFEAGNLRARGVRVKQLETDLTEPYRQAAEWARTHAATLVTAITTQQRDAIRRLIARAHEQGLSPRAVADALRRTIGLRPDQVDAVHAFSARLRDEGVRGEPLRSRVRLYREAHRRRRAMTIARTELISSVNAGQLSLWSEAVRTGGLPRTMRKVWIVTDDERLCPACEALGARGPVPLAAEFAPGVLRPALHPNCRCAMGLVS